MVFAKALLLEISVYGTCHVLWEFLSTIAKLKAVRSPSVPPGLIFSES